LLCTQATKTARGERLRYWETQQLLSALERACSGLLQPSGRYGNLCSVPIILAGDLNASPSTSNDQFGFNNTVYPLLKRHSLGLRSVMNDDLLSARRSGGGEVWTTWKARRKLGKETVARSCVDYILYGVAHAKPGPGKANRPVSGGRLALRAAAVLDVPSDADVGEELLPNAHYPSDHIPLLADLQIVTAGAK
jgi:hypothetical protein